MEEDFALRPDWVGQIEVPRSGRPCPLFIFSDTHVEAVFRPHVEKACRVFFNVYQAFSVHCSALMGVSDLASSLVVAPVKAAASAHPSGGLPSVRSIAVGV